VNAIPALDLTYAPFVLTALRRPPLRTREHQELPMFGSWFLILVEDGRARYRTADGPVDLPPGALYLGHPGTAGTLEAPPGCSLRRLNFDVEHRSRRRLPEFGWAPVEDGSRQRDPSVIFGVDLPTLPAGVWRRVGADAVLAITDRWWLGDADQLRANARLATWLAGFAAAHAVEPFAARPADDDPDPDDPIRRAEAFASDAHHLRCRVEEMARAAGLGLTAFKARYRAVRGETAGGFLRRLRLARAERLLREGDLPIRELAGICGYRSAPAFARSFRRVYGRNPEVWRRVGSKE